MYLLSRSEEIVLVAVWKLQEDAYGVTIRDHVNNAIGYEWSVGAIYAPLHRLEKKGLVRTKKGDPTSERGGRSKIYYEVTEDGKKALLQMKRVHEAIWQDTPTLGFKKS